MQVNLKPPIDKSANDQEPRDKRKILHISVYRFSHQGAKRRRAHARQRFRLTAFFGKYFMWLQLNVQSGLIFIATSHHLIATNQSNPIGGNRFRPCVSLGKDRATAV
jgi:hypothetical protein